MGASLAGCGGSGSPGPDAPVGKGTLTLRLSWPSGWEWEEEAVRSQTLERAVAVEVRDGDRVVARKDTCFGSHITELRMECGSGLPEGSLKVAVWSHMRPEGGAALYDCGDLRNVTINPEAPRESDLRDCQSGCRVVKVRGGSNEIGMELTRPVGRWRLFVENAGDVAAWLRQAAPKGSPYRVSVVYDYTPASGFDTETSATVAFKAPASVEAEFSPVQMEGVEAAALSDWMLLDPGGEVVMATLLFSDCSGNPLIVTENVQIPMKPGHAVSIRVTAENNQIGGGLRVETEWEGEDDIEI